MKKWMIGAALALAACAGHVQTGANNGETLRINQIQVLGTHNSYARPVDPRLLAIVDPIAQKMFAGLSATMTPAQRAQFEDEHPAGVSLAEGLAYDHPPLAAQLDAGLRSLELDIYHDPTGRRFADPAGNRMLREKGVTDIAPFDPAPLAAPGFKTLHIADVDFRSHCPTFRLCLQQVKNWSDRNQRHAPIFVMIEAKTSALPLLPGSAQIAPFDAAAFDALDAEIVSVLGRDRLVTPDDVRGAYPTLEGGVRAHNWPTLAASRGKFVFLLMTALDRDATTPYLNGRPNLEGRVAFLRANPGAPHAAFLLLDNSLTRTTEITQRAQEGYLVRTRSDIETHEARVNDMARANAAFASGAQVVSTDFFKPGNAFGTSYYVSLPGGGEYRCNPVNAKGRC
jgi:hypothetical protein